MRWRRWPATSIVAPTSFLYHSFLSTSPSSSLSLSLFSSSSSSHEHNYIRSSSSSNSRKINSIAVTSLSHLSLTSTPRKIFGRTILRRGMMMSSSSSVPSSSSSFFAEASSDENNNKVRDEKNGTGEGGELYTIESLRNYAQELVARNNSYDYRFCFYVAGGGSMAVSLLAATPGASSFLLEGRTTYDRYSFLNSCSMSDQDTKGKQFSYSSHIAATLASNAALKQALKISSLDDNLHRMPLTIGIGCTSILATSSSPSKSTSNEDGGGKGKDRRKGGRGNVVVTRADGTRLILTIQMKTGRNRFDEDLILSHLVLRSIELLMIYNSIENEDENDDSLTTNNSNNTKEYVTNDGDVVTEQWERPITTLASTKLTSNDASTTTISTTTMMSDVDDVVKEAARRVIDGGEDAVVLLPIYGSTSATTNNNNDVDTSNTKLLPIGIQALSQTVIPNKCLIFPGSFNPPHRGHLSLANASIRTLERLEPYIHPRKHNDKPILFELSLTNVDKPSIDPKVVVSRVQKFLELASSSSLLSSNDNNVSESSSLFSSFPQQWGIVLTRAPLFEEKLKTLRSKVLDDVSPSKQINFVIGTDTLVRILNPKYYQDQLRSCMNKSLLELKLNGVGFIVGGRLEQQPQQTDSQPQPRFVSGRDELFDLPEDVSSMFTVMEESEFRVDLSSSEIRKQQQ